MIRVLVAEDELPLLRGIKKMIEGLHPRFQVVMCAKNGREAMDYLLNHRVDVIFTDINMPMADGIALLKFASEQAPPVETVVISGYRDFSYAQQALRYHAKNYLVKPVDKKELTELLYSMEKELGASAWERKNRALSGLLYGDGRMDENDLFPDTISLIYFCAGSFVSHLSEELTPGYEYWVKNAIREEASGILGNREGIFSYWGKSLNEVLLIIENTMDLSVGRLSEEILRNLPGELPVKAAFCEAAPEPGVIKERLAFLRNEIRRRGIFGKTMTIGENDIRQSYVIPASSENALTYMAKKGQVADLKTIIWKIKREMEQAGVTQENLRQVLVRIFSLLLSCRPGAIREMEGNGVISEIVTGAVNLDQVFTDFFSLCREAVYGGEAGEEPDLMKRVDDYICGHLEEPLTTKLLAQKFGLVPPYLSRLFKEYKGRSPSQYIQDLRMENAEEMLLKYPDMLAKDVAESVGYNNPLYFSKLFKKRKGVYPSEYRASFKGEDGTGGVFPEGGN